MININGGGMCLKTRWKFLLGLALVYPVAAEAAPFSLGVDYEITASSELQNPKRLYAPTNLIAPSLGSAWCEGVDGDGVGEWVELTLKEPITSQAGFALEVVPGYAKSDALFLKNGRPKKLAVEVNGIPLETPFSLEDRGIVQVYTARSSGKAVEKIRLKILDVYRGGQFSDTCISEIVVKKLPSKGEWDGPEADKEAKMLVGAFYDANSVLRKSKFDVNSLEFAMRLADGMYIKGAEGSETLKELYLDGLIINPQVFMWVLDKQKDTVFDIVVRAIISPVNDKYSNSQVRNSIKKGISDLEIHTPARWKPLLDAYSIQVQGGR